MIGLSVAARYWNSVLSKRETGGLLMPKNRLFLFLQKGLRCKCTPLEGLHLKGLGHAHQTQQHCDNATPGVWCLSWRRISLGLYKSENITNVPYEWLSAWARRMDLTMNKGQSSQRTEHTHRSGRSVQLFLEHCRISVLAFKLKPQSTSHHATLRNVRSDLLPTQITTQWAFGGLPRDKTAGAWSWPLARM